MIDPSLVYVAERVQQCLSTDERVHALDIQVTCVDARLFLSGRVSCESRRDTIELVARECIPAEMTIVNQIEVTWVRGSVDEEFVG
jgi:hypothetical protein